MTPSSLLLGIGGLTLGLVAGLAAFSSAPNPLPNAPRSRREIAKIDAGVQRAIAYPRCPDCGNTDVTTGRDEGDFACPKCGQQWEPADAFAHHAPMEYLKLITAPNAPLPKTTKLSKKTIEAAADKQIGTSRLVAPDGRPRRAYYDKRRKEWLVEYDTDPAILYAAYVADDGSIRFERVDD